MAQLTLDLSGRSGLAPNFFGDVNDTSAKPHLRYLGDQGQYADGIFNPIRRHGYLSPANNTYLSITGAINATIIASEYDSVNDDVYLAEAGNTIWRLDGLDDQTLTSDTVVNQGTEVLNDLNIYELAGTRMLFYAYNLTGERTDIGVKALDSDSGIVYVNSTDGDNTTSIGTITGGGSVEALAQQYARSTAFSFDRVILPITKGATDNGGYTVKLDVQKDAWTENTASQQFDGTNDFLSIADASQTGLDVTGDFTIECWARFNSGGTKSLVAKVDLFDSTVGAYRLSFSSETLTLEMVDSATVRTTESVSWTPTLSVWYHIAVTRNGTTGDVKFYIDGQQQGATQSGTTNALQNSSVPFAIGAVYSSSGGPYLSFSNHNTKEVRVWSDVRTQSEIFDNMRDTLTGTEANLVGYWILNGGTDYTDSTSNNNDLTTTAAPTTSTSVPPGVPDGTSIANGTVNPSVLGTDGVSESNSFVVFDLSSTASLTANEKFFLILSPQTFVNMGAEDSMDWLGRQSNQITNMYPLSYDGTDWNFITKTYEFDFKLLLTSHQTWLSDVSGTTAVLSSSADVFMVNADNGFMYVFEDERVHKVDGGRTAQGTGQFTEDVLLFPSYFKSTDAIDTRGRMYIAVQANPNSDDTDGRSYSETVSGVYLWDRISTIVGTRDYLPLYGVRDIKKLYITPTGDVRAICIGDDRFTQIRSITNGGKIIERLGLAAFPEKRDGLKTMQGMTVWLGADGIWYAHGSAIPGEREQLYKIGSMAARATGAFSTGAIFVGDEDTAQSRQSIMFSFTDTADDKVERWYPHGIGSIDSNAQNGNQGNVYTLVTPLPELSTVKSVNIRCIPTSSGSTEIATVKYYFNQSTTPGITKTITLDEASKGYMTHQINKPYVNTIQIEVEWSTSVTLGDDNFLPYVAVVEYEPTNTRGQLDNA